MPMMFNPWPRGDPTFVAPPVRRSSLASCAVGSKVLIIVYVTTSCRPLPSDGQKASAAENGKPVLPMTLTLMASKLAATSWVAAQVAGGTVA